MGHQDLRERIESSNSGGPGSDTSAIHVDTDGEIDAIALKGAPIGTDLLVIEDSEDGSSKKSIRLADLPTAGGGEINTASNAAGLGLALPKDVFDLPFKGLVAGSAVAISSQAETLTIAVSVLATDAQHGVRGGGTQHAAAVSGGAAGFMTGEVLETHDALVVTVDRLEDDAARSSRTGITQLPAGILSINADTTKVDVAATTLEVVDDTTSPPTVTVVNFPGALAVTPIGLLTTPVTAFYVDATNTLVQDTTGPDGADRRTMAFLGFVVHQNNTVVETVSNSGIRAAGYASTVDDLMQTLGDRSESGNTYSANGANNLLDRSPGVFFGRSIGPLTNPNFKSLNLASGISTYLQTFQAATPGDPFPSLIASAIDPNLWDDGTGTAAAVSNNRWTIKRLIFDPRTEFNIVELGQTEYMSLANAIDGISENGIVKNPALANLVLLGWVVTKQGGTDLSLIANAQFVENTGEQAQGSGTGLDPNAVHVNVDGEIVTVALKAAPLGADVLLIEDSAAGNSKKRVAIASLLAAGHTLYVDQNQTIATPTGSVSAPFSTIGAAITAAIALTPSATNPVSIQVASGVYSETITLVTGLAIRSMGGSGQCRITAPVSTNTIVTGAAGSSLIGFMLFGASGAGGMAYTVAGLADVRDCKVQDCETGFDCTAGILAVFDSTVQRLSGQVLTTAYRARTGGQVHAFVSRALGVSAQIATGFLADGAGSEIHVHAGAAVNCAVGVQATDSGRVQTHAMRFENCDVNRLVGPGTLGIMRTGGSVGQANTFDLQVTGTAAVVEFIGDQATAERVEFLSDTSIAGLISEPETDSESAGSRFYADTSVGEPAKVAMLASGEGIATSKEVVVFQFDDSAGSGLKFTDVTAAARSRAGSTFEFPAAVQTADAILFGAPREHGGIVAAIDTAMSADGSLTWEFWNGAAWVELPPGGTRGSGIMVHGPVFAGSVGSANVAFETAEAQHIHYNDEISATWAGDTGTLDQVPATAVPTFWVRVRMSTLPTTEPVFEQIKVLYASTTVGSTGVIAHGGARVRTRIPIFTNIFEAGFGLAPSNQDLSYAPNIDIGLSRNEFANGAVDQVGLIISIPNIFDTSSPIEIELEWQPGTVDVGDVNWELFYALGKTDSFVAVDAGSGTLDEFSDTVLQAANGTVGQGQVATFKIRLPNANPESSDSIALMFRRDATGVDPPDTFVGPARVRRISMNGLVWRNGRV